MQVPLDNAHVDGVRGDAAVECRYGNDLVFVAMRFKLSVLFGIAVACVPFVTPASAAVRLPLGPGVNLPRITLPQVGPGFGWMKPRDYAALAGAGFRFVRQPVAADVFLNKRCEMPASYVVAMRHAAQAATKHGLTYDIDFHPNHDVERELLASSARLSCLSKAWVSLARALRGRASNVVFEILNEPFGARARSAWWGQQLSILRSIRAVDSQRVLIASAAGYDNPAWLIKSKPYALKRIVYTFHDYAPRSFTLQGTEHGLNKRYEWARGTRWLSPQTASQPGRSVKHTFSTFPELNAVERWAVANNVRVFCGEFGVYLNGGVNNSDRLKYFSAITSKLDLLGIPWVVWQFVGGFGIAGRHFGNKVSFQPGVLHALGLK